MACYVNRRVTTPRRCGNESRDEPFASGTAHRPNGHREGGHDFSRLRFAAAGKGEVEVKNSVTTVVAMCAVLGLLLIAGCGGAGSPGATQNGAGSAGQTPTGTVQGSAK